VRKSDAFYQRRYEEYSELQVKAYRFFLYLTKTAVTAIVRIIVEAKAMYGANKRSLSTGTQMPPTGAVTVTGATLDFASIPTLSVMFK
jgi:hypothetical protein